MGNSCISHLPRIRNNKIEIERDSLSGCSVIQEIGKKSDSELYKDSCHGCPVLHRREKQFKQSKKGTLYDNQILQYPDDISLKSMNLSVFYNAPISIVSMNYWRKILFINKVAEEMFGYTAKEIIGKEIDVILPQTGDINLSKFMSNHLDIGVSDYAKSKSGIRKSGEKFPIIIQIEHDWEQGILTVFIQEKLNDFESNSPGLVKALVNISSIPIIAINNSSIIILVSNSALEVFGYSREELIGQNIRILMEEKIGKNHDEYVKRYLRTKEKRVVDKVRKLQALRKNGELFPIELKVTVVENSLSIVKHFVAYIRDMSAMVTSQEQENRAKLADAIFPHSISIRLANGERVHDTHISVSVLFADIVGFTSISDQLSSERLVTLLDEMFHTFDTNLLEKYNLEKIKTMGDCYMLASGIPHEHPDHANNLVEAAFCMIKLVKELGSKYSYILPSKLQVRIGINSGGLIAGIVGLKKPLYDVFGDTVNVASRMESTGIPDKVHISQKTYNSLRQDFREMFMERGNIDVKGKGSMITYISHVGN